MKPKTDKSEISELEPVKNKVTFPKEKILTLDRYKGRADLLGALLPPGEYTIEEVDRRIEKFMKG